jgi:hypothetical protein
MKAIAIAVCVKPHALATDIYWRVVMHSIWLIGARLYTPVTMRRLWHTLRAAPASQSFERLPLSALMNRLCCAKFAPMIPIRASSSRPAGD